VVHTDKVELFCMKIRKHVYVAMSGGVDSAVAAVELLEAGFQVTGIFMETWKDKQNSQFDAFLSEPADLARAVCNAIGVACVILDVRNHFYQIVIRDFIQQYLEGRTPNPCLFCNPQVKWGILQKYALEQGADYFATGHYARLRYGNDDKVQLLRGIDSLKDQSYMLALLSQEQLRRTLLPLGEKRKTDVIKIAKSLRLPVQTEQESQDLCFLQDFDYRTFLQRHAPESVATGEIVNSAGKVLGQHQGLAFYTIGQRRGIKIAATEPYYVIGKEPQSNRLVVGFADEAGSCELLAKGASWISESPPDDGKHYSVMVRYRAKPVTAKLQNVSKQEFRLEFNEPLRGISPGQIVVVYQGEICLGGGVINCA